MKAFYSCFNNPISFVELALTELCCGRLRGACFFVLQIFASRQAIGGSPAKFQGRHPMQYRDLNELGINVLVEIGCSINPQTSILQYYMNSYKYTAYNWSLAAVSRHFTKISKLNKMGCGFRSFLRKKHETMQFASWILWVQPAGSNGRNLRVSSKIGEFISF